MLLLRQQLSLDAYIRSLGPAAWFRMDQGVTVTGAGISQVDDLSGNARHLLDPGTTRPIYLPYSGTKYLYLPGVAGNYASTPHSAGHAVTDLSIAVRMAMLDYTPASNQYPFSKDDGSTNRDWRLDVNTSGNLVINWWESGGTLRNATSTAALPTSDGGRVWVKADVDVDDGSGNRVVRFYTADDSAAEPTAWSQLGNAVTTAGTSSVRNNSTVIAVSSATTGGMVSGAVFRAILYAGIGGAKLVDFNPADASDGATSFASSATGETWTVNSSGALPAQIVGRASALFNGTSHYLKCNAFTLNQPTCVLMVVKQVSWTNGDTIFDGDAANSGRLRQLGATGQHAIYASGTPSPTNVAGPTVGAIAVLSIGFNGASSFIKVNAGAATTGNPGANNMGGFTLGANGDVVGTHSNIQVYETVIFPIAPSTAQLDRLIAGLMARHGVA